MKFDGCGKCESDSCVKCAAAWVDGRADDFGLFGGSLLLLGHFELPFT